MTRTDRAVLLYTILTLLAVLFAVPLVVMVVTSIKTPAEVVNVSRGRRRSIGQTTLRPLRSSGSLKQHVHYGTLCCDLAFVSSLGVYPLSQFRFKGDYAVYMFLLADFYSHPDCDDSFVSDHALLKLYDSFVDMWLVIRSTASPSYTYLRNYLQPFPVNYTDCSSMGAHYRVLLPHLIPLAKPGFAAVIIH